MVLQADKMGIDNLLLILYFSFALLNIFILSILYGKETKVNQEAENLWFGVIVYGILSFLGTIIMSGIIIGSLLKKKE